MDKDFQNSHFRNYITRNVDELETESMIKLGTEEPFDCPDYSDRQR